MGALFLPKGRLKYQSMSVALTKTLERCIMQNSEHFVNVLKMAMDDQAFRSALQADFEGALVSKNLRAMLSAAEIDELKNIFEARNGGAIMNNLECAYRGYK
jgi:hypothetical protein